MKDTSELADVKYVEPLFFKSMRKNFNCATLAGTAALAAFLASAGVPAQAAKHHHHSSDSSSQTTRRHSGDSASENSSTVRHHRRHSSDDQQASDSQTPRHRHHKDLSSDDESASSTTSRHHRHHHDSDDQTASVTPSHHHRHHHDSDDETASNSAPTRRHHHDESADNDSTPTTRRHHHHHDSSSDVAVAEPTHHRHHHNSDATASSNSAPVAHLTKAQQIAAARLQHDPSWLAHVARYEAHMANVNREHELRVAEYEAHEANTQARVSALRSGNVVRAAEAFRGTPYVMGGSSRSGFDCSGFTRYIFGESAGVDLPRTAEEQYYTGKPIDKTDLKAGDLVFFRDTYRHGISHVGMYIGDGRFVHACNPSKGVTVSSLSEQYYINHWAGARRVIHSRESTDL